MTTKQVHERDRIAKLMARAIHPDEFNDEADRAHGVYRIGSDDGSGSYRFGVHPRRKEELERQFDKVELVVLFGDEDTAKSISAYLNGAW